MWSLLITRLVCDNAARLCTLAWISIGNNTNTKTHLHIHIHIQTYTRSTYPGQERRRPTAARRPSGASSSWALQAAQSWSSWPGEWDGTEPRDTQEWEIYPENRAHCCGVKVCLHPPPPPPAFFPHLLSELSPPGVHSLPKSCSLSLTFDPKTKSLYSHKLIKLQRQEFASSISTVY